jgi:hypothetical protein
MGGSRRVGVACAVAVFFCCMWQMKLREQLVVVLRGYFRSNGAVAVW